MTHIYKYPETDYIDPLADLPDDDDDCTDILDEDVEKTKITSARQPALSDDTPNFMSDEYCTTHCEFHHLCYANHEICLKQAFEDILNELNPREKKIIRMKYGWYHGKHYTVDEMSKELNLSVARMKQIVDDPLQKLLLPPIKYRAMKLEKYFYEAFSVSNNNFYSLLLCKIFDISPDTLPVDVRHSIVSGIDYSLIDKDKKADVSVIEIKTSLDKSVHKFDELKPYTDCICKMNIRTLYELLHLSRTSLLSAFEKNDVALFNLLITIDNMGYKMKGNYSVQEIDTWFIDEFKNIAIDNHVYDNHLDELPLKISLILFENNIITINDLIHKLYEIEHIDILDANSKKIIDEFLYSHKLIHIRNEKKFYLTFDFWTEYFRALVYWMRINLKSISLLLEEARKSQLQLADLISQMIETKYPEFDHQKMVSCIPIEEMELSVRAFNCLKRVGIKTLGDISTYTYEDLMKVRHLGRKASAEVIDKLSFYGIELSNSDIAGDSVFVETSD